MQIHRDDDSDDDDDNDVVLQALWWSSEREILRELFQRLYRQVDDV